MVTSAHGRHLQEQPAPDDCWPGTTFRRLANPWTDHGYVPRQRATGEATRLPQYRGRSGADAVLADRWGSPYSEPTASGAAR
jgi:hypothetical protein